MTKRKEKPKKTGIELLQDKRYQDWAPLLVWSQHFYRQQREYSMSDEMQVWFIAGNGTGKTRVLYWNLIEQMLGIHPKQLGPPPIKVKVLVPSFEYVVEQALPTMQDVSGISQRGIELGALMPASMVKKGYSKDHRAIVLKNGSVMRFATSEQGWRLMRGAEFDILGCDEEPEERVYQENFRGLRNAKGGGRVYAGLTPPFEEGQPPTWTKEKIVDAAVDDPNISVHHACMMDNPAITPEFIKEYTKGMTHKQVRTVIYGEHPTWGDLVHPDFMDQKWNPTRIEGNILPNDHPMPENWMVDWVMAFDWHPSKPCAAVFGFVHRDGNIVIFDELAKETAENKEIPELANIFNSIEGLPHEKRLFRRWQDPSAKSQYQAVMRGFNAWDAFRQVGIVTSAGKNRDPNVGISIMNNYLTGNMKDFPRLLIYERCKHLIRSLKNHYWKRGADGKGKPDPKWSDYPICVRYILQDIGWNRKHSKKRHAWPLQSFTKPKDDRHIIDVSRWM